MPEVHLRHATAAERGYLSLESLSLRNFKALGKASGRLSLKPLTVLVGPNSAGKSSYLHALLMLRQTIDSRDEQSPLLINGPYVDLGSFHDVLSRWAEDRTMTIELSWKDPRLTSMPASWGVRGFPLLKLVASIYANSDGHMHLTEMLVTNGASGETLVRLTRSPKGAYKFTSDVFPRVRGRESARTYQPLKFFDIPLELLATVDYPADLIMRRLSSSIERVLAGVAYLGPLREFPSRIYLRTGEKPADVGLRGEQSVTVLLQSSGPEAETSIMADVNTWLEEFGMAQSCRLERLSKHSNYYVLTMRDPHTGYDINYANMGFGVSQVLPVIVQSLYLPKGSTLIIEQPEIHLHPKAQSVLADLLIHASRDKKIIVETHSEHFLTRLQRRVGEEKLDPSDVAIYYCASSPQGTMVSEIKMDRFGQFESWPEGFFAEELDDRFKHMKAIAERHLKERHS